MRGCVVWRELRHWVTGLARDGAVALSPWLSRRSADRVRTLVARVGPHLPVLARQVRDNMRAAGVYRPEACRAYFAGVGDHLAGSLEVLRCAAQQPGQSPSPEFLELAAARVRLGGSVERLAELSSAGRGAIIMGPHTNNNLVSLALLNRRVPMTALLRYAKDERRQAVKQHWYQVSGIGWISEPPGAAGPLGRLKRMSDALARGQVVLVLLDLPQKLGEAPAVRCFGRDICLPSGAAVLAVRTSAPVFFLTARPCGSQQELVLEGPVEPPCDAGRRDAARWLMQAFADCFESMVRAFPEQWYMWGDKRWARVFGNDVRYARVTGTAPVTGGPAERAA
jgi:lauroyl/myristoyl acyltransferase